MRKGEIILCILFMISLIVVMWINFFENLYIFTNYFINTDKINRIIETISMSYITSFIFYVVIYFFKYKEEQKIILPFIADSVFIVMNSCLWFCNSIRTRSSLDNIPFETSIYGRSTIIYPTEKDLNTCCKEIYLFKIDDSGLLFSQIMVDFIYKINIHIKLMLEKSAFIDVELLSLLTDIQTSGFHQDINVYNRGIYSPLKYEDETLMVCKKNLEDYFKLFIKLEKYSKIHLVKYVKKESLKIKNKDIKEV